MDLAADGVCGSEMCPETAGPSVRRLPVPERRSNARDGRWQVAHDELGLEPQDGVPSTCQRAVAPAIGPLLVIAAIDLDDEPQLGGEQVDDEPTEQGHLPAKCDAELPAAKCREEPCLGSGRRVAHLRSALFDLLGAMVMAHGEPPGPGEEAGLGPPGAGSVTCEERGRGAAPEHGAERAPQAVPGLLPGPRASARVSSTGASAAPEAVQGARCRLPHARAACARLAARAAPLAGRGRARIWGRPRARRRRLAETCAHRVAAEHPRVGASIAELVRKVGHVTIDAPTGAKVTVDGAGLAGEAPFADPIDVTPGKHAVVAKMGDTTKNVDVVAGEGETVSARFVFADGPLPLPTPPPVPPPPPPPAPEPPSSGAKLGTAIALGGGAAVALGVGIAFVAVASGQESHVTQLQQGNTSYSCFQSTSTRCSQLASDVSAHKTDVGVGAGLLVGGGALALGAVGALLFWPSPRKDTASVWVFPAVTPAGAGLGMMGRF